MLAGDTEKSMVSRFGLNTLGPELSVLPIDTFPALDLIYFWYLSLRNSRCRQWFHRYSSSTLTDMQSIFLQILTFRSENVKLFRDTTERLEERP